jgi:hypothetical protein
MLSLHLTSSNTPSFHYRSLSSFVPYVFLGAAWCWLRRTPGISSASLWASGGLCFSRSNTLFSRQSLRLALEQVGLQVASLRRATKCLTMDYLAGQIEDHNPSLYRLCRMLSPCIPQAIRWHPFQVNIGETLAVATKPG